MTQVVKTVGFLLIISFHLICAVDIKQILQDLVQKHQPEAQQSNRPVIILLDKTNQASNINRYQEYAPKKPTHHHHAPSVQNSIKHNIQNALLALANRNMPSSSSHHKNSALRQGSRYDRPRYDRNDRYRSNERYDRDDRSDILINKRFRPRESRHRNRHDRDGYDRDGYDRDRYDRDRYDRDRYDRDRYDSDRYKSRDRYRSRDRYDRDRYESRDRNFKDISRTQQADVRSPVLRTLLRVAADITCMARSECEDECSEKPKRNQCEDKCKKKYECPPPQLEECDINECAEDEDGGGAGNGNPSTRGVLLEEEPNDECTRCKKK